MNEQKLELMRRHLGKAEVRKDIVDGMLQWRSDIQVTIGRAARLLYLSENQLRDWEVHGLLHPIRLASHRQYSLEDLDKLVIVRALINAKFAPGDIPSNIDEIANIEELRASLTSSSLLPVHEIDNNISIDQRVEHAKDEIYWRFFTAHILRVSLMLIGETLPNAVIGILLPFHSSDIPALNVENLPGLGTALVGWLSEDGSSHVFLTTHPSFQNPIDYCLYPLASMKNGELREEPEDSTLIILGRKDKRSRLLSLSASIVDLIRRLLAPLYEEIQKIQECFGQGMKDQHVSTMDRKAVTGEQDILLKGIADMIVRWGGYVADGRKRWRFCTILLPDLGSGETLPLRQQSLITRAQSDDSPYIVDKSTFSPSKSKTSLSIRAYQSGCVVYRPELSMMDRTPALTVVEGPVRSSIAIPVGGERGLPVAVLYVASDELAAFPERDQQLLRIASRLIEDVLVTYRMHKRETENLKDLMHIPGVVDALFREFLSENDLMRDIEAFLVYIYQNTMVKEEQIEDTALTIEINERKDAYDTFSIIAIDLDEQESLTYRYGDQIMRHLSKAMGLRIQELILSLVTKSSNCTLYYMYAGRFYIVLQSMALEKVRDKAKIFKRSLDGRIAITLSDIADKLLIIPNITVHVAINSYRHTKLVEYLREYTTVADACVRIYQDLDTVLKMGTDEGGNVIMSWDPEARVYIRLESAE